MLTADMTELLADGVAHQRLLLLQRRLAEWAAPAQIEKTGRGRYRLVVQRPLSLIDVAA